jgi:hypothetical protein
MWQSDGIPLILVEIRHFVAVGSRTRGLRTTTLWICAFEGILCVSRGWGKSLTASDLQPKRRDRWDA